MSISDIIMVVCKQSKDHACQNWGRFDESKKEELVTFCNKVQFPCQGEQVQQVITQEGVLKLIMWLPGKMAKDYSLRVCGILTSYLASDTSMHKEL